MKLQILDRAKKKKFIERIGYTGVTKINELLIKTGKERIRAFSGNLSREEIMDFWKIMPIEGIGLYVAKDFVSKKGIYETRLSLDGLHLLKNQIKNNILVLTKEQEEDWFKGKNIELNEGQDAGDKNFVSVKSSDGKDFIGTAKLDGEGKILYGFLPKERRRKSQVI